MRDLLAGLAASWGPNTGYGWDPAEPIRGQCVTSSLVLRDYLGGNLARMVATYPDGRTEHHYVLRLPSGAIVDATNARYPSGVQFLLESLRAEGEAYWTQRYLADDETRQLYLTLSQAVTDHLSGQNGEIDRAKDNIHA